MDMRRYVRLCGFTLLLGAMAGCEYSSRRSLEMAHADPTIATAAYDSGTVETFQGQIVGIERVNIDPRDSGTERQALIIKFIGNGNFPDIYLGPADYMAAQGLTPSILDYAEIEASRVETAGLNYVARQLKIGETSVVLRDSQGNPYWSESGDFASSSGGLIRFPQ